MWSMLYCALRVKCVVTIAWQPLTFFRKGICQNLQFITRMMLLSVVRMILFIYKLSIWSFYELPLLILFSYVRIILVWANLCQNDSLILCQDGPFINHLCQNDPSTICQDGPFINHLYQNDPLILSGWSFYKLPLSEWSFNNLSGWSFYK